MPKLLTPGPRPTEARTYVKNDTGRKPVPTKAEIAAAEKQQAEAAKAKSPAKKTGQKEA
ncbi:MAG: hypothetical protein AAGA36_00220 [Pseudomonadota bacterium]